MDEIRIPLAEVDDASTRLERNNHLMGTGPAVRTLRNVNVATMTVHLPPAGTATGAGVVVCPGGAWHVLAIEHEGDDIAAVLSASGIAAFVVEYRLQPTPDGDAEASEDEDAAVARAWREAGRPVELHPYADGGHGFGSLQRGATSDAWLARATRWIERTTSAA